MEIFNKHLVKVTLCILIASSLKAQLIQNVKGRVTDKELGSGLPGVVVRLTSHSITLACVTDQNGYYKLAEVPVGRRSFLFTYTGYKPVPVTDVIIVSGKEAMLNIDMEESAIEMEEAIVRATNDTDVVNTMQSVNMKSFSIEETERYPGSRTDPARMAQNFAGVQGTDDSRNDIVIRGNSPAGLLWRLEEIDIPNPNHFAVAGSAGGPQSIINNKYLANSEFYTGAFPANYGNALGGVFDLKMRNGNNERHERTFQFGFLGTELALEGPLSKKTGATYLISYRYSTLALFSSLNINIGTTATPNYQDAGIRLNFPTQKAGVFSFSGIGGLSGINIMLSKFKEPTKELYGDKTRDQYFNTDMGVGILSHLYSLNSRTVMKTSLAYSTQNINAKHDFILRNKSFYPNDTLPRIMQFYFYENKSTLAWYIKSKIDAKNSIKFGFFANRIDVNYFDKVKVTSLFDTIALQIQNKPFKKRVEAKDNFYLLQPYVNYVHKFNNELSFHAGIFSQLLTLNNRYSIEPRASLRYQFRTNQALSISYGLHSQMQPVYLYYAAPDSIISNGKIVFNAEKVTSNMNLDFSKSQHFVAGYDFFAGKYLKFKAEAYFQNLWNVPVYVVPSSVSLLNRGASFSRFFPVYTMQNSGTGYNYGLELTVEKLYHRNYFFMFSGSLFESKYTGSNGKTIDTDFNGNYMLNVLSGVEYNIGKSKKDIISIGGKFTYGGGKRYSPVNVAASNAIMDIVADDEKVNTLRFADYNRIDLRVSYKINLKKSSVELALDLINVMSTKNILALSYAPNPADLQGKQYAENYQLGFLPLFYVRVDF